MVVAIVVRKNPTGDHRLRWLGRGGEEPPHGRGEVGFQTAKGLHLQMRWNWKRLKPALIISRYEQFLIHRLLDPILRRFLHFSPFPFSARFFRPFGARYGRLALVSLPRPFPIHIPIPICAVHGTFVDNHGFPLPLTSLDRHRRAERAWAFPWQRIGRTDTDKEVKERTRAVVIQLVPAFRQQLVPGQMGGRVRWQDRF